MTTYTRATPAHVEKHSEVGPIPLTVNVDVSDFLGDESGEQPIAAYCFPPQHTSPHLPQTWAYLMHGGSYDWHYWHLPAAVGFPTDTYSFAAYLSRHGVGAIAVDHPGCGAGASRWDCEGSALTLETIAQAHYQAVVQMRGRLKEGTLVPGVAPVPNARVVGIGHSMGGAIAVATQGVYRVFDALGVLGWSNQELLLPGLDLAELMEAIPFDGQGYSHAQRGALRYAFYLEDVDSAVIAADERWVTTTPVGLMSVIQPGVTASYASEISAPVLMLFGERDVTTRYETEPSTYPRASKRSLYIQQGSAHCHNLSTVHETVKLLVLRWLWEVTA